MILGQALGGGGVAIGAVGHRVCHHRVGCLRIGQYEYWGDAPSAVRGLHLNLLVQWTLCQDRSQYIL